MVNDNFIGFNYPNDTVFPNYQWPTYPTYQFPQPCPTCHRCPTCGRGSYSTYTPMPYWYGTTTTAAAPSANDVSRAGDANEVTLFNTGDAAENECQFGDTCNHD